MRSRLLLASLLTVGGCHWALHDPGTNPPPAELYFPSGIAIDPVSQFAYVSNANADLKYGGGTVQMYDVLRFECAVARYRDVTYHETIREPLASTCTAFDFADITAAQCQPDPRDRTVIDCNEKPFVLEKSTVKVGNFAGGVRAMPTA